MHPPEWLESCSLLYYLAESIAPAELATLHSTPNTQERATCEKQHLAPGEENELSALQVLLYISLCVCIHDKFGLLGSRMKHCRRYTRNLHSNA